MSRIVECVMNFSEGRNPQVIDRIAAAIEEVYGVALLDRHADSSHNRAVLSFAGSPLAVEEAAVRATGKAAELVDLRRYRGVHPRIGATDVVPFIPIEGVTLEECAALALRAGERIARQFGIPVYLYGAAATRADRRDLADIRRGEFEGLQKEIILNDARIPDFGDRRLHPSAGATAVGAREALIAFNVYLETEDISIAQEIARAVRARSGGLPSVKALAFNIPERRQTQVSMNLVNFRETSMAGAFAAVRERAERRGIRIAGSEIVGLVPQEALLEVARSALQIENFSQDRVLEKRLHATLGKRLAGMNVAEFVGAVGGNEAMPAGGSVAALAIALAAALAAKACRGSPQGDDPPAQTGIAAAVQEKLDGLQERALELVDLDARVFQSVLAAQKLGWQPEERHAAVQAALKAAAEVPMQTAEAGRDVLQQARLLRERMRKSLLSEVAGAVSLAVAGVTAAAAVVVANLDALDDSGMRDRMRKRLEALLEESRRAEAEIRKWAVGE